MENDKERISIAKKLQNIVSDKHTYAIRAREFHAGIKKFFSGHYRISIKIGAPNRDVIHEWGDYHYALAMKRSFERFGHFVRIDILPEWNSPNASFDDVSILLRGSFKL